MSHVSVYVFWGVVALLVLAAGLNHGWHHVRDSHLRTRLTRAVHREGVPLGRLVEVSVARDVDR